MRIILHYLLAVIIISFFTSPLKANEAEISQLKQEIFTLAESFKGQGDTDFARQKQLDILVDQLLAQSKPKPLSERLNYIYGSWEQVWGPYDYRNKKRGIDPKINQDDIYQVVFPGGYYYNVNPIEEGNIEAKTRIGLLRGQYEVEGDKLKLKFTDYKGNLGYPTNYQLWQLAELAENNELPNKISIVPSWIVKLFFGGGYLREVYTDADMRISYGSGDGEKEYEYIYIMRRKN